MTRAAHVDRVGEDVRAGTETKMVPRSLQDSINSIRSLHAKPEGGGCTTSDDSTPMTVGHKRPVN